MTWSTSCARLPEPTSPVSQYVEAFTLGNAAILTNVCLLPLYPGLLVLLANGTDGSRRSSRLLGVVVLAGVIVFILVLGFVLHQVQRSVADILDWVLPIVYLAVAALGLAMILGRNPFTRLATAESPIVRSPTGSAFLYGMLLAPMTLPCTGPLVVSAFVIGGVAGTGQLAESLGFAAFALGFGWPLVVLPFLAVPVQRRATRWLAIHHHAIGVVSGVLLVAIAVFGWWTELRPSS